MSLVLLNILGMIGVDNRREIKWSESDLIFSDKLYFGRIIVQKIQASVLMPQ